MRAEMPQFASESGTASGCSVDLQALEVYVNIQALGIYALTGIFRRRLDIKTQPDINLSQSLALPC